MSMTYEDLQSSESEKKSQGIRNGLPAPQVLLKPLSFGPRLFLLFLGLNLLLLVGICVIGSKNSKIQRDLETLRATYSNFTSNTEADVQALHAQCGCLQEMITSLKTEVEKQGQQLQAAHSLNDKVFSLESKLEKELQELKAGYSDMVVRVQELARGLNSLNCQMVVLKSNGSQKTCCPINWLEHECSCYLFSSTEKPWPEAEKYCQLENAHLVVVNSLEEQKFIEQHTSSVNTWMGLSDLSFVWFWVDWTDIEMGFQYWRTELQDEWYRDLPMGSGNCVYFSNNGRWFYDICQRPYRWVCEKELNKVG